MNKYLIIIISFLLLLLLVQQCNKKTDYLSPVIDLNNKVAVTKVKSLKLENDSLKRLVASKNNSITKLKQVKNSVVTRYITFRDTSVISSICDTVILVNDLIISEQDSVINFQSEQIASLTAITQFQDTIISNQHQQIFTLTKQNKREKRRKVFTSIGTFILGVVVGRIAN